jgi:uncharacterized membrane protein YqjE
MTRTAGLRRGETEERGARRLVAIATASALPGSLEVTLVNNAAENSPTTKSIAAIVADVRQELKQFLETRVALLNAEYREKLTHWKTAAPLAGMGLVLLCTAYLLITFSLVALAAVFINSQFRWFFAFFGVGILWPLIGGAAGYIAYREFQLSRLIPEKTVEILKRDKVWLQQEVRNRL